jgi:hypothetical protein
MAGVSCSGGAQVCMFMSGTIKASFSLTLPTGTCDYCIELTPHATSSKRIETLTLGGRSGLLVVSGATNSNGALQINQITTTSSAPTDEWDIVTVSNARINQVNPVYGSGNPPALRTYLTGGTTATYVLLRGTGSAAYVYDAGTTLTTVTSQNENGKFAGVFDGAVVQTITMGSDGDTVMVYSATVTTVTLGASGTTTATQDYLWLYDASILSGGVALGNNWKQAVIEETNLVSMSGGNNIQVVYLKNVVITGSITGMGSGVDRIYADGLTMTSSSSVINMESDDDFVLLSNSVFGGVINMGSQDAEVVVQESTLTYNGAAFILGESDTVDLYNVNAPLVDLDTTYGTDEVRVQGSTLRSISTGSGNDEVYITSSTIETIDTASGNDVVYMFSGSVLDINLGSNSDEIRVTQNSRAGATIDCENSASGVYLTDVCSLDVTLVDCPAPQTLVTANCCI